MKSIVEFLTESVNISYNAKFSAEEWIKTLKNAKCKDSVKDSSHLMGLEMYTNQAEEDGVSDWIDNFNIYFDDDDEQILTDIYMWYLSKFETIIVDEIHDVDKLKNIIELHRKDKDCWFFEENTGLYAFCSPKKPLRGEDKKRAEALASFNRKKTTSIMNKF